MLFRVLFVCTGNTCRSPMAEALLSRHLAQKGWDQVIEVRSAGICASEGASMATLARRALRRYNCALTGHKSSPINPQLMNWADVILTMTRSHKQAVSLSYPEYKEKVLTVKEYANGRVGQTENLDDGYASADMDVDDPYGGNEKVYEQCAAELAAITLQLMERLENELQEELGQLGRTAEGEPGI